MGVLITLLPSAIAVLPKGGIVVALMLFISLLGLMLNRDKLALDRWERYFVFSFVGYFVIVALNLWWFNGYLTDLDTPSRLILVLPIFFFLRKVDIGIDWFILGVIVAAVTIGITQIAFGFGYLEAYPFKNNTGIMTLYASIFGLMCLFFIDKDRKKWMITVLSLSAILAIVSSILLGGRGGWISAVLTLIFLVLVNPMNWSGKTRWAIPLLFSGVFIISSFVPQTGVHDKVESAIQDVSDWIDSGKINTSSGNRLEMWKASLKIIQQNPIIGVGEGGFQREQKLLIDQGGIGEFVARYQHPHGEYFTSFVEQGLLGFVSTLLVYFIPAAYFLSFFRSRNRVQNGITLQISGIIIALHYIFYSFTSGVFDHQSTALFYAVFMAITLGLIKSTPRKIT